jgi:hypothetical protein
MLQDDLDRILASDDMLEPSSGFARSVMDAVRREAAEPPAPAFPWLRFSVGVAASGGMAAAATVILLRSEPTLSALFAPFAAAAPEIAYAAASLLVSLAVVFTPRLRSRS